MGLSIGIVGLPNVGKSTVFNALTGAQNAEVANYPFCTIKPNRAVVALRDERVDTLRELVGVPDKIYAAIEFLDIAGLVKGASQGEGLGNQFLGQIRNTDTIVHVVRCFDDPNVVHISGRVDPKADIEIINVELALADMEQLERKIERLTSAVKGDRKLVPVLALATELRDHLATGEPVTNFPDQGNEILKGLDQEMHFLSSKPVIYAANVDETGLGEETDCVRILREEAERQNGDIVVLCAKLEEEMVDMSPAEQAEFLELAGATESGLNQVVRKGFERLGLISFFTKNENEVRAWNVPAGTTSPKAAGVIHTDFERGFIRAEVIPFETYVEFGSDTAIKSAGQMRLEGKEYIVQDGDLIYFRFNV